MASSSRSAGQPAASTTCQPKSACSAGTTTCWGTPSAAANTVRKLSWRPTTSASAAPNASASSVPAQPQRHRHVVNRRGPLQLIQEPQPFWANDNGITAGRSTGHQRLTPTRARTDPRRQLGDGRGVEQRAHRKFGVQAGVDRSDQPHRRQRVPAQVEERVVDPDPLQPEHLGVDAGQDLLGGSGRGAIPHRRRCTPVPAARGGPACR